VTNARPLDVSPLPTFAFGHRNLVWWGTGAMMLIEGTMFLMLMVSYVYLKGRNPQWPPGFFAPVLFWGTLNTAIMLVSVVPNYIYKQAAEKLELRKMRVWMLIALAFGVAFNVVRIFEYGALNVWWDSNAYGSVVWALLTFHTVHTLTDLVDSAALTVLMFTGPVSESHFVDVSENAYYWYFVVLFWLPIYAFIYLAPRFA
jgi:heme/copper-type cytochrome/quinol oxidase subunit 3